MTSGLTLLSGILLFAGSVVATAQAPNMQVYKDPTCGCCVSWVEHLRKAGLKVAIRDSEDMTSIKQQHNVPSRARSCHTGIVNGYVIEGHVPAADVQRLLRTRPAGVVGLAVPGMPIGSPGMEVSDGRIQPFDVLAFDKAGRTSVFSSHGR